MFSIKNKLDKNLRIAINKNYYKNYRVIIQCRSLLESIEKKIKKYKGTVLRYIPYINCICAILSPNALEKIAEYPQVKYITFDTYALLCGNNSSPNNSNNITFEKSHKLTGKNICIALIDSGIYPHSDILTQKNKIKKFVDLISNYEYPYDNNGHGTFLSGLICGNGCLSKGMYKGIAQNSCLYVIKAFNSIGKAYISDILFSISIIISERDKYNIKVICLPFEIVLNDYFILSLFQDLFNLASNYNLTVVVPSGHSGNLEGSIGGIAALDRCITVSGIDNSKHSLKPYKHSSCGPFGKLQKPDICAPCVNICSLNTNKKYISERNGIKLYPSSLENPYTTYTGTSCAAAYISGICALLYENNPDLTFNDLLSILKLSCDPIEDVSTNFQGAGMINLNKINSI